MIQGGWLEPTEPGSGALACWSGGDGNRPVGVLLLPGLGYEYSSTARTLSALRERLHAAGCWTLQVDYPGTGDSAGSEPDLRSCRAAIAAAAQEIGNGRALVLLGIGWGGTLALDSATAVHAAAVAALAPALPARRCVRQLRLLSVPFPTDPSSLSMGGYALPGDLLADLAGLEVELPASCPILVVETGDDDAELPGTGTHARWRSAGLRSATQMPAEAAVVDEQLAGRVTSWVLQHGCSVSADSAAAPVPGRLVPTARIGRCDETVVRLGPSGLPGVLTEPVAQGSGGVLVLLNTGSDPHTGPGRAWVELARYVATSTPWSVLRFDARGWGVAGDGPERSARPYDPHMLADVVDVVSALRERDRGPVVLGGLCAGAWMALEAQRLRTADGVIALNPQMYWSPGDPVEPLIADTIARRADEAELIRAAAAQGRWDAEDAAGLRPPAGLWLDELAAQEGPVHLLFAEGDPGLQFLQDRLGRRLAEVTGGGQVAVRVVRGTDHALQQVWTRERMFDAVVQALAASYP